VTDLERLTPRVAAVRRVLLAAGYQELPPALTAEWPADSLAFEDKYAVVGVFGFTEVAKLQSDWLAAESLVVDLISSNISTMSPKSWDGYLLLMSAAGAPGDQTELARIRGNTRRLRKLIVTSDDLDIASELPLDMSVKSAIMPLLPLSLDSISVPSDPLATLPARMQITGLRADDVAALVAAYRAEQPMIQLLHTRISSGGRA
jgi:hypothetical protein